MLQQIRKWIFPIVALIIGIGLLYLALRGVDFDALWQDLARGKYIWAVPFVIITLIAHLIRSWRWRILLEALPEQRKDSARISLHTAFSSVMIGFMANYAAPRLGEFVRASHMSLRQKLRFGSVFGTVAADRILDMAMLGLFLLTLPWILGGRFSSFLELIRDALGVDSLRRIAWIATVFGLVVILLGAIAIAIFRKRIDENPHSKIGNAVSEFRDGITSLTRSGHTITLLGSTLAMWACYLFLAFIPLLIFGLAGNGGLNLADSWALLLIGALGIIVPSPGGVGSYHFITIQSLVILWGVSQESAASYAIFSYAAQLILYTIVGFTFILIEGATWRELRSVPTESTDPRPPTTEKT
ncbi:MAG: lysylphosphatidylglycerol synthase transmembrane domain-containing protein [Rhodothermia bacterium]|nr:MAG: lysylphosphatidylglycerol synthase transmembrane domain-containing protein [Rhodothermia bacterium]